MAFHADFDSEQGLLEHSCDKYRDAAAGAVVIQRWMRYDGKLIEIEMLPENQLPPEAVTDAEYQGLMSQEEAARKVGELTLQLETYRIAS